MSENLIATPPSVSWAQKNACVFLTFNVECDKPDIKIEKKTLSFKGICAPDNKLHEVVIPLYADIDPEKSAYNNKGRIIEVVLAKENTDAPFWPFLTNDKKKHHWLKVDFNRWQDEDDSEHEFEDMFQGKGNDYVDDYDKDESSSEDEEDLPDVE